MIVSVSFPVTAPAMIISTSAPRSTVLRTDARSNSRVELGVQSSEENRFSLSNYCVIASEAKQSPAL
jgi:hypothetical protein